MSYQKECIYQGFDQQDIDNIENPSWGQPSDQPSNRPPDQPANRPLLQNDLGEKYLEENLEVFLEEFSLCLESHSINDVDQEHLLNKRSLHHSSSLISLNLEEQPPQRGNQLNHEEGNHNHEESIKLYYKELYSEQIWYKPFISCETCRKFIIHMNSYLFSDSPFGVVLEDGWLKLKPRRKWELLGKTIKKFKNYLREEAKKKVKGRVWQEETDSLFISLFNDFRPENKQLTEEQVKIFVGKESSSEKGKKKTKKSYRMRQVTTSSDTRVIQLQGK